MKKTFCFVFFVLSFLVYDVCFAEYPERDLKLKSGFNADWERYVSSDLQALIETHSQYMDFSKEVKMNINALAVSLPYRFKMEYQGEFRTISQEKRELLGVLAKSGFFNDIFIDLFETEVLVKDGSNFYWFPVQSFLINSLKKEILKGAQINLYVMFAGTVWEADQFQWVFIVNEFEKIKK